MKILILRNFESKNNEHLFVNPYYGIRFLPFISQFMSNFRNFYISRNQEIKKAIKRAPYTFIHLKLPKVISIGQFVS